MKPRRRPHCRGVERLRILELKAARRWSKAQAAERFFLQPATIAEWTKRIDEEGEGALVETPEPINRFPAFVRHIVIRLKVLCRAMGKKRIAQTLARAGLVLGVSTVGRILKERERQEAADRRDQTSRVTFARLDGSNHVASTAVPSSRNDPGFVAKERHRGLP